MAKPIKNVDDPRQDLLEVGEQKPLGSLEEEILGSEQAVQEVLAQLGQKNIQHLTVATPVLNGRKIIMAFSREHLAKLLECHLQVLDEYGWPRDPDEFVFEVAVNVADYRTKIYDVICLAFGNNPDAERALLVEQINQRALMNSMYRM